MEKKTFFNIITIKIVTFTFYFKIKITIILNCEFYYYSTIFLLPY